MFIVRVAAINQNIIRVKMIFKIAQNYINCIAGWHHHQITFSQIKTKSDQKQTMRWQCPVAWFSRKQFCLSHKASTFSGRFLNLRARLKPILPKPISPICMRIHLFGEKIGNFIGKRRALTCEPTSSKFEGVLFDLFLHCERKADKRQSKNLSLWCTVHNRQSPQIQAAFRYR